MSVKSKHRRNQDRRMARKRLIEALHRSFVQQKWLIDSHLLASKETELAQIWEFPVMRQLENESLTPRDKDVKLAISAWILAESEKRNGDLTAGMQAVMTAIDSVKIGNALDIVKIA